MCVLKQRLFVASAHDGVPLEIELSCSSDDLILPDELHLDSRKKRRSCTPDSGSNSPNTRTNSLGSIERLNGAQAGSVGRMHGVSVVLLHPFPPLGGNIDNQLVREMHQYFTDRAPVVISLNLRGAGSSGGRTSWTGEAELADLRGVLLNLARGRLVLDARSKEATETIIKHRRFCRDHPTFGASRTQIEGVLRLPISRRVILVGYSYGSVIVSGLKNGDFGLQLAYVLVAYPYSVIWALTAWNYRLFLDNIREIVVQRSSQWRPDGPSFPNDLNSPRLLMIAASRDNFTSIEKYQRWWQSLRQSCSAGKATGPLATPSECAGFSTAVISCADHGFLRREAEVIEAIDRWLISFPAVVVPTTPPNTPTSIFSI